ncbi:MAG: lipase family protein [Cyanothece sp. SIO1E1]|nr:lipase family protein [Cyanothece sp. SIO1E1]
MPDSVSTMDYSQALRCAGLCQEVYEGFSGIMFDGAPEAKVFLIEDEQTDTQVAILYEESADLCTVIFRGSSDSTDWDTNLALRQQVYPYGNKQSNVKVHQGFISAYLSVRDRIQGQISALKPAGIVVTGHSLGGALATLCSVDLQYNEIPGTDSLIVYTYGSPRVGNAAFVSSYKRRVPNTKRFVFGRDVVTRLPTYWQNYRHVGEALKLGQRFDLNIVSRRVSDHKIANYIEALRSLAAPKT